MATLRNLLVLLPALLAGCSNDEEPDQPGEQATQDDTIAPVRPIPDHLRQGLPEQTPPTMLTITDSTPPEEWLASIQRPDSDSADTSDSAYYRDLLARIQPHVHEDKRMIANRSVQTSRSLLENDIDISARQLLESFALQLGSVKGRYVYGELCAHYGNLRKASLSHREAIESIFRSLD